MFAYKMVGQVRFLQILLTPATATFNLATPQKKKHLNVVVLSEGLVKAQDLS